MTPLALLSRFGDEPLGLIRVAGLQIGTAVVLEGLGRLRALKAKACLRLFCLVIEGSPVVRGESTRGEEAESVLVMRKQVVDASRRGEGGRISILL